MRTLLIGIIASAVFIPNRLVAQKQARHSVSVGAGFASSNLNYGNAAVGIGLKPSFSLNYDYFLRRTVTVGFSFGCSYIGAPYYNSSSGYVEFEDSPVLWGGLTGKVFLWKGLYTSLGMGMGFGGSYYEKEVRRISNPATHTIEFFGGDELEIASPLGQLIYENISGSDVAVLKAMGYARFEVGYKLPISKNWALDFGSFIMVNARIGGNEFIAGYAPLQYSGSGVLVEQTVPFAGAYENVSTGEVYNVDYKNGGFSALNTSNLLEIINSFYSPSLDFLYGFNVSVAYKF